MTVTAPRATTDKERWGQLTSWLASALVGMDVWHPSTKDDPEQSEQSRQTLSATVEGASMAPTVFMWSGDEAIRAFAPNGHMIDHVDVFYKSDEQGGDGRLPEPVYRFIQEAERVGFEVALTDYTQPHNDQPALRVKPLG